MSPDNWTTLPHRSLFRRTARNYKESLERLQVFKAEEQLAEKGVRVDSVLRVAARRWHGFWRVQQLD